jgi:hypothetical protein
LVCYDNNDYECSSPEIGASEAGGDSSPVIGGSEDSDSVSEKGQCQGVDEDDVVDLCDSLD